MTSKQVLIGAAIFYVFVAPFFFHPDLKIIYSLAGFLWQGVGNIYAHYSAYPHLFPLGPFVYPPLAYFLLGGLYPLIKFLGGPGFGTWLTMGNTAVQVEGIFRFILAIKLSLIAAHLLSGWLLMKLVSADKKNLAGLVWFFNPISIYIVALMGQIDGLAVFFIILALMSAKNRSVWGAVSLGLGAAIKSFPLLLLPIYVILVAKSWKQRIILGAAGLLAYGLWIAGFLNTPGFYSQALASGLSKSVLTAGVPSLLIVIVAMAFIRHQGQVEKLNNYFLLAALAVLAGIHFHPQWAMWALPMVVIYVVRARKWWWGGLFLGGWVANVLSFPDKFLTYGLLVPFDYSVIFLPSVVTPVILGNILIFCCLGWLAYDTLRK